jgi:hypothetical protein
MTKKSPSDAPDGPRPTGRGERTERLAAALKANLRRRKAQARERAAGVGEPPDHAQAGPTGAHDSARVVVDKQ